MTSMRWGGWLLACCGALAVAFGQAAPPPTMAVQVRVVGPRDEPLAGVSVSFWCTGDGLGVAAAADTAADGSARVTVASRNRVVLQTVTFPAAQPWFVRGVSGDIGLDALLGLAVKAPAAGAPQVVVRAGPGEAHLTGLITDADQRPVPGAIVAVSRWPAGGDEAARLAALVTRSPYAMATAGADGRYDLAVPPGQYRLASATGPAGTLWHSEAAGAGTMLRAALNRPGTHNLALVQGAGFRFTLRGPDGQPVPGVTATTGFVGFGAAPIPPSGADGVLPSTAYRPGTYTVTLTPPDGSPLAPVRTLVRLTQGQWASEELALPLGGVLRGRLLDTAGQPLAGITFAKGVTTDQDGRYLWRGLPTGPAIISLDRGAAPTLTLDGADGMGKRAVWVTSGGELVQDLLARPTRWATVRGRVVETDGRPVPGVTVRVMTYGDPRSPADRPAPAVSGDDGRYQVTGVMPGNLSISQDFPADLALVPTQMPAGPTFKVEEGATLEHEIKLQPALLVRLTVRDEAGQPVPDLSLQFMDFRKSERGSSSFGATAGATDAAGLTIVRLPLRREGAGNDGPGRRTLTINRVGAGPYVDPNESDLEGEAGPVVERAVVLRGGARLVVTVVGPDGQPVPDVGASLTPKDFAARGMGGRGFYGTGTTDAAGQFTASFIPPGEYLLNLALPPAHPLNLVNPAPVPVIVGQDKDLTQRVILEQGGTIEGTVRTWYGRELAAVVTATRPDPAARFPLPAGKPTASDPAAKQPYRIAQLPAGRYKLNVSIMLPEKAADGARTIPAAELSKHVPETFVEVRAGETVQQDLELLEQPPTKEGKP